MGITRSNAICGNFFFRQLTCPGTKVWAAGTHRFFCCAAWPGMAHSTLASLPVAWVLDDQGVYTPMPLWVTDPLDGWTLKPTTCLVPSIAPLLRRANGHSTNDQRTQGLMDILPDNHRVFSKCLAGWSFASLARMTEQC